MTGNGVRDPNDLRNKLIKKLVVDLAIPESVIEDIIIHEFVSLDKALRRDDVLTAEISGLGKFTFSKGKGKHFYEKKKNMVPVMEEKVANAPSEARRQYEMKRLEKEKRDLGMIERRLRNA